MANVLVVFGSNMFFRHNNGFYRAGLFTQTTHNAAAHMNIKNFWGTIKIKQETLGVTCVIRFYIDRIRRANSLAQFARYTSKSSTLRIRRYKSWKAPISSWGLPFFFWILKGHLLFKHAGKGNTKPLKQRKNSRYLI